MADKKLNVEQLIQGRAVQIMTEHLDAYSRFYRLTLPGRKTLRGLASAWVKSWGTAGTQAFVYLVDQAKGFATHRELNAEFWGGGTRGSQEFFGRLKSKRVEMLKEGASEPTVVEPIYYGREYFFCAHGIAVSLAFGGLPHAMREQVIATKDITAAYTANLRGVVEQVLDDPGASVERKDSALAILRSWGAEPKPKPKQAGLFDDRTGTEG